MEAISAPHPHNLGFSSTVTSRPVFATSESIVCVSSGTSERTSITVHVEVFAERNPANPHVVKVTEANLTYVAIDRDGKSRVFGDAV